VKNPKNVGGREGHQVGFNTFSILDATRSLRQFFAVLDLFLEFSAAGAGRGFNRIVNTLVMAFGAARESES
jgi:hypothetical protein